MRKLFRKFWTTLFPPGQTHCEDCKEELARVIYMGLPMKMCFDDKDQHEMPYILGFWSFIFFMKIPFTDIDISIPCNGVFTEYSGPYWLGLLNWIFQWEEDEPIDRE